MELSKKLSKSPSTLLRSPTIKSGINSLTSLDELERSHHQQQQQESKALRGCCWPPRDAHAYLRERLQLLVPPSIIVAVPLVWWCVKTSSPSSYGLIYSIIPSWYWLNVSAMLVLCAAVVVSVHLGGGPHLFGSRALIWGVFRDTCGQSWLFVNTTCLQLLGAILQQLKENERNARLATPPAKATKPKKTQAYGEGVQTFSNGDVYEGEFYRGKFSGSGVYYFYKSGRYEGDWVDGKYDGYGVETWARGSRYRGQYRQGMREGYGIYRFYTGDVYSGHWSNGQSNGCGMQTCGDGSCYVGEFKWGVKHGFGHYQFRNGDMYAGEYFADKMHGYGVYKFANGHRYEGSWHDGRKQGLGIYTFRNGDTHCGHWHVGTLESRSVQIPNASAPVTVAHSKVLNAVQEARRAAQRGMDVEKVDDRVKKAVGLANQAANAARVAAVKALHR